MKKNYYIILNVIVVLLLISACVRTTPIVVETKELPTNASTIESTASIREKKFPSPSADASRVCGTIVYKDQVPFGDKTIFLAPVYEGTAIVLDTSSSPGAKTGDDGYFCTAEISPGEYALVIGSPEEAYEIYSKDNTVAFVFMAEPGIIVELGQLETNLSP